MGTCYYLVRRSDKALFDLDKWRPSAPWDGDEFSLPPLAELTIAIADEFARMGYTADEIAEVARRMIAFAQGDPVSIRNDREHDLEDSIDDGELRIVDSRFPSDWVPR